MPAVLVIPIQYRLACLIFVKAVIRLSRGYFSSWVFFFAVIRHELCIIADMTSGNDNRLRRNTRLSQLTDHILGPVLRKQGKTFQDIAKHWTYIGGKAAEWSLPLAVTYPDTEDGQATLTVAVSSARAPEIQMLIPELIERANSCFGYLAIGRIRIDQSSAQIAKPSALAKPIPPAQWEIAEEDKTAMAKLINDIKDPDLRQALDAILSARDHATKTP